MSQFATIARPYAKAIFEYALDSHKLSTWSNILNMLTQVILIPETIEFISNPNVTKKQAVEALLLNKHVLGAEAVQIENLLQLLAQNNRLVILPSIYEQYELLRHEQEKILTAHVRSSAPLTQEQQEKLVTSLSQRLQRRVTLEIIIDDSLIGGAIIQAGNLVFDGSVREKLNKLSNHLAVAA